MVLRYLVWLAVPLLALLELAAHAYHATRVPQPDQWQEELPAAVQALHHQGDLIVAAPYWSEPNLRFALGDELMPLRDIARPDERGYSRAIEVSVSRERSPQLLKWEVLNETTVGKFHLRVLKNPTPSRVLFDFVDNLNAEHASAALVSAGTPRDCTWDTNAGVSNGALDYGHPTYPKERFRCPASEWNFVGVTVIEDQQYRPKRCIWAPPAGSRGTRVTFSNVPMGNTVRGYSALPFWNEREGKHNTTQIQLTVDGVVVGNTKHADGEGWKEFEFPTTTFSGKRATVQFDVTTVRGAPREYCFYAEAEQ
ncbi:MAG TPA: hypothetical protein VL137_11275 [Polyangiaceae bacterium]|jgi:hypothetical protein|nr:hypothetical protein [Polyangiaceae bacterium]